MQVEDTIVAISTPPGRGAIGIVRLAGPDARSIAEPMLRLNHELAPNRASFGSLIDPESNEKIDEVVVTFFAKPHSYTTDDIVEISAHGAPVVLRHVVEMALARGARLAEPGEFTMRAFLNGRLDLTQAEAVRDLIESQTLYQARVAAQQLGGALSNRLSPVKQKLVELIATLEAGVDFAEDDVSVLPGPQILGRIDQVAAPLRELCRSFAYGKLVHEGLTLAIVGRPNVGKSSLFNRLVERERAIVTATPGTTRDLVTETVAIGGIPVRLVDTAGIREALDEVESIGIRKSMEALADADVIVIVLDATDSSGEAQEANMQLLQRTAQRPRIIVANKIDIATRHETTTDDVYGEFVRGNFIQAGFAQGAALERTVEPLTYNENETAVPTSALTGEGVQELRHRIIATASSGAESDSAFLTNVRQQHLVEASLNALSAAVRAVETSTPHEMLLLDLYNALRPLDEITGATTTDDILNLIFSTFCIGK